MNQVLQLEESKQADPEPQQDVAEDPKPERDPGVSEDVWQELQLAKMLELMEQQRIKEEEEEAKRYWLEILPPFSHSPTSLGAFGGKEASNHVKALE